MEAVQRHFREEWRSKFAPEDFSMTRRARSRSAASIARGQERVNVQEVEETQEQGRGKEKNNYT